VTTLDRSVGAIENDLVRYGLAARCVRVMATGLAVLSLEDPSSQGRQRIAAAIEAARRDDGAEAVVLGRAGMADLAAALSAQCGLPVVDGVAAAVTLAEGPVRLGLKTSNLGGYAPPLPKAATVAPERIAAGIAAPRKM
jgi:allantoin racemase